MVTHNNFHASSLWFLVALVFVMTMSGCAPSPAGEFCRQQNGTFDPDNPDSCTFQDSSHCPEWIFYYGQCAPHSLPSIASEDGLWQNNLLSENPSDQAAKWSLRYDPATWKLVSQVYRPSGTATEAPYGLVNMQSENCILRSVSQSHVLWNGAEPEIKKQIGDHSFQVIHFASGTGGTLIGYCTEHEDSPICFAAHATEQCQFAAEEIIQTLMLY